MKQALGLVEIQGLSTAVVVADTMAKAADVRILEIENTRGLGYITIKLAGDVGAVNAAVNAGRQVGISNQKLVSSKVIPRPSDYVSQTFCEPKPLKPAAPLEPKPPVKAEEAKPEAPVQKTAEPNEPEVPAKAEKEPETKEQEPARTKATRRTTAAKNKK